MDCFDLQTKLCLAHEAVIPERPRNPSLSITRNGIGAKAILLCLEVWHRYKAVVSQHLIFHGLLGFLLPAEPA